MQQALQKKVQEKIEKVQRARGRVDPREWVDLRYVCRQDPQDRELGFCTCLRKLTFHFHKLVQLPVICDI